MILRRYEVRLCFQSGEEVVFNRRFVFHDAASYYANSLRNSHLRVRIFDRKRRRYL